MLTHSPTSDREITPELRGARVPADPRRIDDRLWPGDGDALVVAGGDAMTYTRLREAVGRTSAQLRRAGVREGDVLPVVSGRSPATAVGMFAAWRCGAVVAPFDPVWPPARVADLVRRLRPAAILAHSRTAHLVDGGSWPTWLLDEARWSVPAPTEPDRERSRAPEGSAYIMFTSGSTGDPKGVVVSHHALGNYLSWRSATVAAPPGTRVLALASPAVDVMLRETVWPLTTGASVVFVSDETRADPAALVRALRDERIHVVHLLPAVLDNLLDEDGFAALSDLRLVHASAEPLPGSLVRRFRERCPAALHHSYGPTEAAVSVTFQDCTDLVLRDGDLVPLGNPVANVDIHLFDEQMRAVPLGDVGEIYIGGACLATGYWADPELTRQSFVPHPTSPSRRLYRTGDRARLDSDGLRFAGRRDDQVKVRGYRIEPAEVEHALRGDPRVADAVVTTDGAGSQLLALVRGDVAELDTADVRARMAARLPAHLVPSRIFAVSALPRNDVGKLDRVGSAALARSMAGGRTPVPAPAALPQAPPAHDGDGVRAETLAVWRSVFGRPDLTGADDFFDLGGNSLIAMRIATRLRRRFGPNVQLRLLFSHPTADSLADAIAELRRTAQVDG
jgi:amino acid adenylation domain-containing protein